MTREEESKNIRLNGEDFSREDIEALRDLEESIDNLIVELQPKPREYDLEIENRLSCVEGKLDLLIVLLPVGFGAIITILIFILRNFLIG